MPAARRAPPAGRPVEVGAVDQLLRLVPDRLHHPRVAVADRVDRDAANAVQIASAAGVPDPGALPPDERQGQLGIVLHQVPLPVTNDLLRCRPACVRKRCRAPGLSFHIACLQLFASLRPLLRLIFSVCGSCGPRSPLLLALCTRCVLRPSTTGRRPWCLLLCR